MVGTGNSEPNKLLMIDCGPLIVPVPIIHSTGPIKGNANENVIQSGSESKHTKKTFLHTTLATCLRTCRMSRAGVRTQGGGVGMVQKVNRDHGTIVMKGNRSRTHKLSVKHLLHRSRKWASFVHSFIINVRQWIMNWFEIIDNCRYTKIALVVWAGDVASQSQWRGRWWWHFPSLLAFTRHQLLTKTGPGHYAAK